MTWWLIALLLLAAFGPIFWLMPSRRDRQLAAMRQRARMLGMQVELCRLPEPNPEPQDRVSAAGEPREVSLSCVAYRLPYGKKLAHVPVWRLQRNSRAEHGLFAGWSEQIEGSPSQSYWSRIGEMLPRLPADCIALECDRHQVSCYWRERPGTEDVLMSVNQVAEILENIKKLQLLTERSAESSKKLSK